MESITAFVDGPLSFITLYAFITRAPYRHVAQILLSLCQLYGDVLYFSTEVRDNIRDKMLDKMFQIGLECVPIYCVEGVFVL